MLSMGPLAGPTKTLVGQATRDNDSPPSGYQLDLLCKASFSSPNDCDQLLDAILRRLDSSSANVKWKTLRVMAYLCQNGNVAIRKEFQRKIDRVRACTNFVGPLHPLRGDAPNEKVRVAAKDALAALFSTRETTQRDYSSSSKFNHLSGGESFERPLADRDGVLGTALKSVISTAASLVTNASSVTGQFSSYQPSGSSYQITGMGNPAFQRSNSQPSVLDKMKQVLDPRLKSHSITQAPQSYTGLQMGSASANRSDFDVKPAMLDNLSQRRRGEVGGSWAEDGSEVRLSKSASKHGLVSEKTSVEFQSRQAPEDSGVLERRIIEELTASGGVTATPPIDQLSSLLNSIESLDQALIAGLLSERFDDQHSWQTQVKALAVLEALIKHGCTEVAEHFAFAPEQMIKLASSNLRAVRSKADKVYDMLGLSKKPAHSKPVLEAPDLLLAPPDPVPVPDLLDVDIQQLAPPSSNPDPLEFLLQQPNGESFPFISEAAQQSPASLQPTCSADFSFVGVGDYIPISEHIIEATVTPFVRNAKPNADAFSFLNESQQGAAFISPQEMLRSTSDFEGPVQLERTPSHSGSAFSFVGQPSSDRVAVSDKPLDPFANAIKAVRKDVTASRDTFSFVQDIIKDNTSSR